LLKKIFSHYSASVRRKRGILFNQLFNPTEETKILDLGGGDGTLIKNTVPFIKNIYIADINRNDLEKAKQWGFKTLELDETGKIPCSMNEYDIIFSNSVIEHVTVNKEDIYKYTTNKAFRKVAFERQKIFASEIQAKCGKYYVQTPYKYFLIESHSWLPGLIVLFPRKLQFRILSITNKFWPKKTEPDWHLLTISDMKELFPDAIIMRERSFLFTKSLIAVKN
jgi:SAM-dependent methyltransferase